MAPDPRPRDVLDLPDGVADPEVGRWLSAFAEARRDTDKILDQVRPEAIDADLGDGGDTLGTVLYHTALIEIGWVFWDVLDREANIPKSLFPHDDRVVDGRLTPVLGETLEQHRERLAQARSMVWAELASMSNEAFHRVRTGPDSDVSANWVVFHLIDHEVEHRVRTSAIRDAFRK